MSQHRRDAEHQARVNPDDYALPLTEQIVRNARELRMRLREMTKSRDGALRRLRDYQAMADTLIAAYERGGEGMQALETALIELRFYRYGNRGEPKEEHA